MWVMLLIGIYKVVSHEIRHKRGRVLGPYAHSDFSTNSFRSSS